MSEQKPDKSALEIVKLSWFFSRHMRCPHCREGKMFRRWKDFDVVENCPHCGIKLAEHDSGDGPAFFIIFFLSFIVAPLALWLEASVNWPFWVHILLWGVLLILTALLLIKPLKALMIFLQYEMRPEDWEKPDEQ